MLLACCSAVVVFPHHFGPSISTAPFEASLSANILSAILLLYSIVLQLISSYANVQIINRISAVGAFSLPQLARFHFRSWRFFVMVAYAGYGEDAIASYGLLFKITPLQHLNTYAIQTIRRQ